MANLNASPTSTALQIILTGVISEYCITSITDSLSKRIGITKIMQPIQQPQINSSSNSVNSVIIVVDEDLITLAKITSVIEELGFGCSFVNLECATHNITNLQEISIALYVIEGIIFIDSKPTSTGSESIAVYYNPLLTNYKSISSIINPLNINTNFTTQASSRSRSRSPKKLKGKKRIPSQIDSEVDSLTGFYSDSATLSPSTPIPPASLSNIKKSVFEVTGMTCASCVNSIEKYLTTLPGIHEIKVALLSQRAEIQHDDLISVHAIIDAIEGMGFDAREVDSVDTVKLSIRGMTCASCSSSIERQMQMMPGVASCVVNLLGQNAIFKFDKTVCGIRDIVEEIESLGFDCEIETSDSGVIEALKRTKEISEWWFVFLSALVFAIPVTFVSMIGPLFMQSVIESTVIPGLDVGDLVQLVFTIPAQFWVGKRFYVSSFTALKHGTATMDVLVCLGTSLAFGFSVLSIIYSVCHPLHPPPTLFFETSTTLITFISLGRFLENYAKGKTSSALSALLTLTPKTATLVDLDAEFRIIREQVVVLEYVKPNDVCIIRPGEKVPVDGVVVFGKSEVDEALVTGESKPVEKLIGSMVVGGSVNGTGRLFVRALRVGGDSTLAMIVRLVSDAQMNKAPIQAVADKVAGYFVPIIVLLGFVTFALWIILLVVCGVEVSTTLFIKDTGSFFIALNFAISVIVVACPCALGLATPTAVMVGTGIAAKLGILLKGGASFEQVSKLTKIVFDKTGTLTTGTMMVVHIQSTTLVPSVFLGVLSAAEESSEHHIAKAIVRHARDNHNDDELDQYTVSQFTSEVGKGVLCVVNCRLTRRSVCIGNEGFLRDQQIDIGEYYRGLKVFHESQGHTVIFVGIDGVFGGFVAVSDTLKPETVGCINALKAMRIEIAMITGDQPATAKVIARQCGIQEIHAAVSPAGKKTIVERMQTQGHVVAMVGDGINDSGALVQSDCGIAVYGGTDVAVEAANVVLMKNDLRDVVVAIHLIRRIYARIRLNFVWATVYNVAMIPLAMGVFVPFGVMLRPMVSGMAMSFSSVSVVVSSLLLRMYTAPHVAAERKPTDTEVLSVDEELRLFDGLDDGSISALQATPAQLKSIGSFSKLKIGARDMIRDLVKDKKSVHLQKSPDIELGLRAGYFKIDEDGDSD